MDTTSDTLNPGKARKGIAPETAEVLTRSKAERLAFCRRRWWIDYPRATAILGALEALLAMERVARPPCMMVVGSSNNGKTTLAKHFVARHPVIFDEFRQVADCPVLFVPIISRPDLREIFQRFLDALGLPYGANDHPNTLRAKVERHIKTFNVRMIVIDEMNTLSAGTAIRQREALAQIRALSVAAQIPIVCFTTKQGERMAQYDKAFFNRFRPEFLPQWEPDIQWRTMLARFEGYLPLPEPSGLSTLEFSTALSHATGGLLGEVHDLLEKMTVYAIQHDLPRLTKQIIDDCGWMTPADRAKAASYLKD